MNEKLPILSVKGLTKKFYGDAEPQIRSVTFEVERKSIVGIIGPDGSGKTTLLRLLSGVMSPTDGRIEVNIGDLPDGNRGIGYLPQNCGLYDELTVYENCQLYADLYAIPQNERVNRIQKVLHWTGLFPFVGRKAAHLSGGMRQKLGLACILLAEPPLLLMDEPTVGIDPLAREEFWSLLQELKQQGNTVILSTAYLDEADRCDRILVLHYGRVIFYGSPQQLLSEVSGRVFIVRPANDTPRSFALWLMQHPEILDAIVQGECVRVFVKIDFPEEIVERVKEIFPAKPRIEDAVLNLLLQKGTSNADSLNIRIGRSIRKQSLELLDANESVIEVINLTKRFGDFTAVDHISFSVYPGEIFGLIGPNGAGKTTIFKMLCGLMKPTSGAIHIEGIDMMKAASTVRGKIGYMAQHFSLYRDLTVYQNLIFFAGIYGLSLREQRKILRDTIDSFSLSRYLDRKAASIPYGVQKRLSLACAAMHKPSVLFLDEPTSGVDPMIRREIWRRIQLYVAEGAVVIVTTHFLDEAEYCDRIALIQQGKLLAVDTPMGIKTQAVKSGEREFTLEEAIIFLLKALSSKDRIQKVS